MHVCVYVLLHCTEKSFSRSLAQTAYLNTMSGMEMALEDCDAITEFEDLSMPKAGQLLSRDTAMESSPKSNTFPSDVRESNWNMPVQEISKSPALLEPPTAAVQSASTPVQAMAREQRGSRDGGRLTPSDLVSRDGNLEGQILAELQKSNLVRLLAHRVRALQEEAFHDLQSDVTQLRTENGHLRAQFAKNGMELPGAMPKKSGMSAETESLAHEARNSNPGKSNPSGSILNMRNYNTSESWGKQDRSQARARQSRQEMKKLARAATMGTRELPSMSRMSTVAHNPAVFANYEQMKEQVREAIKRPPYHVAQYYKLNGCSQSIARNIWFEYFTFAVIAFNAIWIAIDTDYNREETITDADPLFQAAEYFFIVFFLFEWCVRFAAFARKQDCLKDSWFIFDSSLVALMMVDTWQMTASLYLKNTRTHASDASILKIFRMLRITRTARMARLLKALPELTILIKGIWVAARSVFFTLLLLAIIIYVFAVALRQMTDDTAIGDFYFKSVPYGMKSLLLYATLPDMAGFVDEMGDEHIVLALTLLVFILMASLTVLNMLVGVLVEVVSVVSAVEKEQLLVSFVKKKLLEMLKKSGLDADEDMMISRHEFEMLLVLPQAAKCIQDVGVDPVGLVDFSDYIFQDSQNDKLTFSEFIDLVLELRGSNHSTVKDVVDLRTILLRQMEYTQQILSEHTEKFSLFAQTDVFDAVGDSEQENGRNLSAKMGQRKEAFRFHSLPEEPGTQTLTLSKAPQPFFSVNPTPSPPVGPSPKVSVWTTSDSMG